MKRTSCTAAIITLAMLAQSCADQQSKAPDFYALMDRTVDVIVATNNELAAKDQTNANALTMNKFTERLHAAINANPHLYASPMGLELLDDASFKGFDDKNGDNKQDIGEEKMFTLEIDAENNRLVCTDYTGEHHGYRVSGAGFFAGALMGNLLTRQRNAGVNPGRFNGTSMRTTSRAEMTARRNARSRARSGGARSGK
ncbi:MAG: hypothetical protein AAGJ73_02055 [Pseudomonadota bacterium]